MKNNPDIHKNSQWLIEWSERMFKKFGPPPTHIDWCRKLAYSVGEQGQDHPSDYAIAVARKWETLNWNYEILEKVK